MFYDDITKAVDTRLCAIEAAQWPSYLEYVIINKTGAEAVLSIDTLHCEEWVLMNTFINTYYCT